MLLCITIVCLWKKHILETIDTENYLQFACLECRLQSWKYVVLHQNLFTVSMFDSKIYFFSHTTMRRAPVTVLRLLGDGIFTMEDPSSYHSHIWNYMRLILNWTFFPLSTVRHLYPLVKDWMIFSKLGPFHCQWFETCIDSLSDFHWMKITCCDLTLLCGWSDFQKVQKGSIFLITQRLRCGNNLTYIQKRRAKICVISHPLRGFQWVKTKRVDLAMTFTHIAGIESHHDRPLCRFQWTYMHRNGLEKANTHTYGRKTPTLPQWKACWGPVDESLH